MKENQSGHNVAARLLAPNLQRHPGKTAYLCGDEQVSYQALADGACRFATLLRQHGIGPGDRVLLALFDSPVFVAAFLGTALVGGVAVPVGTALSGELYRQILDDCGARLILASPAVAGVAGFPRDRVPVIECGERFAAALPDVAPALFAPQPVASGDLAFMLYTSGSTGTPKGVPHCHADLPEVAERYAVQVLGMRADDIVFSASKLNFAYGLGNSLAFPLHVGATALLHAGPPLPEQLLPLMERHRPTLFFSVPTVYAQIIRSVTQERLALPMRFAVSAGEALPVAVLEEWRRLTGMELIDGIGSTEMAHIFISNRPGDVVPGSAGTPVPGYEIRLIDDSDCDVLPGEPGHLLVRGPGAAPYYWNRPDLSERTMRPDGFVRTGDLFVEQGGRYFHKGRSDDMMKVGGQWVSPVQIEEAFRHHPAITDCAAAACRVGGLERPALHLVLQPGQAFDPRFEKELRAYAAARLPDYMRPMRYLAVGELPRNATGKVQRFKLRQSP